MDKFGGIKNIVFDLGVVLFNLDYQLSVEAFKNLGLEKHDELFSAKGQIKLLDQFERGEIEVSDFIKGLRSHMPGNPDDQSIINAWNVMLLGFPQSSIDLLNALKPNYNLYLLSNTNDLHFERFHQIIEGEHGLTSLDSFFINIYYSHKEGLRKPESAFYNRLIDQEGLNPSETVFIDDMLKNVEGAEQVGMSGVLLKKHNTINDLFDENRVLRS